MPLHRKCEHCQGSGKAKTETGGWKLLGEGVPSKPMLLVDEKGSTIMSGVVDQITTRRSRAGAPSRDIAVDPDMEPILMSCRFVESGTQVTDVLWHKRTLKLVAE